MLSHSYQIVGSKQKEESLYFMLNSLLQSRIETGEETTDDEDVNVYLATLMHSFLDQSFQEEHGHLASTYSTDVARSADTNNLRHRYRVYRTNGDYALISTSDFRPPPIGEAQAVLWSTRGGSDRGPWQHILRIRGQPERTHQPKAPGRNSRPAKTI